METNEFLLNLYSKNKEDFEKDQIILSFDEFIDLFTKEPIKLVRSTHQYLYDLLRYFSSSNVSEEGDVNFDNLFDSKVFPAAVWVVGQQEVYQQLYKIIRNLALVNATNKLVLLHGPNGSSKTSIVESVFSGMEYFSCQDAGRIYRFNWVFPNERVGVDSSNILKEPIGFDSSRQGDRHKSFAYLEDSQISSKLICEMKDNPIFLLPKGLRKELYEEVENNFVDKEDLKKRDVLQYLLNGGLCKKCQQIYENLFQVYKGNLSKVFQHVQIERFFFSKRYRAGIATIEPQMNIDAFERQVTMDTNFQNLPSVLQNVRFYEPAGDLVDANRGLIEFSDLLKRPIEAYKYLLTTVEKSTIKLPNSLVYADLMMLGSTNEKQLDAFKQTADFASFKGRIELVTVPYLLEYSQEEKIYVDDVRLIEKERHVSPHVISVVSLWAVMTRLLRPNPELYPAEVKAIIGKLGPLAKAKLYDSLELPDFCNEKEKEILKGYYKKIKTETKGTLAYEGRFGASPRELKQILLYASQSPRHNCLNIISIVEELEKIVKDKSVYEFLQIEVNGGFHDAVKFIEIIKQEFFNIFEQEVYLAMEIVEEGEQSKLLNKYITHITSYIKKEKIYNEVTRVYEDLNERLMQDVERQLDVKIDKDEFRNSVLSKIAAYKIENPDKPVILDEVLSEYFQALNKHYYQSKLTQVAEVNQDMLVLNTPDVKIISEERKKMAQMTLGNLKSQFGYCDECALASLAYMLQHKKKEILK